VIVPESGDAVQTLKAGLMEIADVFCINKSDRPGADRIAADLRMTIDTRRKTHEDWEIPLVQTEAVNGKGMDSLYEAINSHVAYRRDNGEFEAHRRAQLQRKIRNIVKSRFQNEFLNKLVEETRFDQAIEDIRAGKTDPFKVGNLFFDEFTSGQ
jgi:GTPase